ncbi:MAG: ATP-dependent DNA ligase [Thermodesulfobacteriota bacterium]
MITKPMLAGKIKDIEKIEDHYPMQATPKLDGIRCIVVNGQALSKSFLPIPNNHIRKNIEQFCPDGFDGEIIPQGCAFNKVQSIVMTVEGTPDFEYHVFDYVKDDLKKPYLRRIADLVEEYKSKKQPDFIKLVIPHMCPNEEFLMKMHQGYIEAGYEGIILRSADGPYKCGKSTVKEGFLLKLKKFDDSECEVLGMEALFHNTNKAEKDKFGRTKRSKKKEGMIPLERVGAFLVKDIKTGVEFKVSTGLNADERKEFWIQGPSLVGKLIKYKYQGVGPNKKPRFPVFLFFRDKRDMS